ncbi:MAG: purine-nucleoside phosphorylase [Deltaproteobacteria bacterium]|nr:purine-nucleoside phosphorylase [Deltaproteobacteria bacterium]
MQNYFAQVSEAAAFLKKKVSFSPKLILVLSGGLEALLAKIEKPVKLLSTDIPYFPKARAKGHKGELVFGHFEKMPLVVLNGRFHFYEGLSPREVVFPYFVLNKLGAKFLVTTNAVGGVREDLYPGDILLVEDQINAMGTNPLIGLAIQNPENQFPGMENAYDSELRGLAETAAGENKIGIKKGVFLGNPGPSYETPAEIRMYRQWGGDTVGMSTVFETIAARFLKMRVLTLNIVTNRAAGLEAGPIKHDDVLSVMRRAESQVVGLLQGVLRGIARLA